MLFGLTHLSALAYSPLQSGTRHTAYSLESSLTVYRLGAGPVGDLGRPYRWRGCGNAEEVLLAQEGVSPPRPVDPGLASAATVGRAMAWGPVQKKHPILSTVHPPVCQLPRGGNPPALSQQRTTRRSTATWAAPPVAGLRGLSGCRGGPGGRDDEV